MPSIAPTSEEEQSNGNMENDDKNVNTSGTEAKDEGADSAISSPEQAAIIREKLLDSRVETYLYDNIDKDEIDVEEMTVYMRRKYKDYRSKTLRPTVAMVTRAYERVAKKLTETSENNNDVVEVENNDKPVKKKKKTRKTNENKLDDNSMNASDDIAKELPLFEPLDMLEPNFSSTSKEVNKEQVPEKSDETASVSSKSNKPKKKRTKENQDASFFEPLAKKNTKEFVVKNSTKTFKDIGGNEKLLKYVVRKIKHIKNPEIIEKFKTKSPPRGFLVHGPPGCGKTLLARAIAGQLEIPLLEVAATDLVAGVTGETEENMRDLFDQAIAIAPCVLFLDKIDTLATNRENAQKGMEKRVVHQLCTCLDKLSESENKDKVLVLGATDQLECLDPSLRTPGRFEEEFCLEILSKDARADILKILTNRVKLAPDVSLQQIAQLTPGFVASELDKLINEAENEALSRVSEANLNEPMDWETNLNTCLTAEQLEELKVEERDFEAALKIVKPSVKKEGFVTVPNVTWNDVGSLRDIREELKLAVLASVKYPDLYDEIEAGVLLCGPPGCGKTLLAKAMANEIGINFISVKGPEFLNKYVGESESNVRKCFARARNAAPCIIFFDELDGLCPKRSEIDGNATTRIVNAMLVELDGVNERKDVFVMAATNRPDIIDPALLRSGRFDKIIYVGLPKPEDRLDILRALTKNGRKPKLSENVSLAKIAYDERCEGFTGADLKGLVKQAKREFVRDKINEELETGEINVEHFDRAFNKVKPSVKRKHLKQYKKMAKLYSVKSVKDADESDKNSETGKKSISSKKATKEKDDSLSQETKVTPVKKVNLSLKRSLRQSTQEKSSPSPKKNKDCTDETEEITDATKNGNGSFEKAFKLFMNLQKEMKNLYENDPTTDNGNKKKKKTVTEVGKVHVTAGCST